MKKFALVLALILLQTNLTASAAVSKYNKKPAKKNVQSVKPVAKTLKTEDVYKQDGDDYLLKYNINDLEAAPWLNDGKRIYK